MTGPLDEIILGRVYVYTKPLPKGCRGAHYFAHREILDVPSYQYKILVEALDGPDAGLWFTCTSANFRLRYALVRKEPADSPNEQPNNEQLQSGKLAHPAGPAS